MPRLKRSLAGQKGSLMVIVLGFSIILSMAAASLMLTASNSRNDEDITFRRMACFNDAESGLMIGVGWLRNNQNPNSTAFIQTDQLGWPGDSLILQSGVQYDNRSLVTVTVYNNLGASTKTVKSQAISGTDTVRISWNVGIGAGGAPNAPTLVLQNWQFF